MKFFLATFAILAVLASASAFVIPDGGETEHRNVIVRLEDVDSTGGIDVGPTDTTIRHRRLTCDLFSFSSGVVTPNHSACALKCIGMGRAGGHCEGASCVCRSDSWVPW
ncbi:defensin-2-like [Venturia canescens]|uniref:defensin-2-like n=1 Tax=Venturia canescens TaxID=32260 RepID=UPI001C9D2B0C|nr:defensin-2-like [Venturia canescens]